jgi:Na+-transporting NADH:ubiquinone oxidoreductase subunit NqrD
MNGDMNVAGQPLSRGIRALAGLAVTAIVVMVAAEPVVFGWRPSHVDGLLHAAYRLSSTLLTLMVVVELFSVAIRGRRRFGQTVWGLAGGLMLLTVAAYHLQRTSP